ncbi:hypothetical protein L6V77_13990 [Myxococcota bacterium]|nr:hypothetical protein [Myxococcota bacterium]
MNMRHMLLGLAMVLGSLAGCGSDGAGVETETETRTDDAGEGGAGGFGGFPCTAPPEDVSASPRAEERIEMLALSVSPGLIARQADYDRIARDVAAIEATNPSLRDFPVYPAFAGFGHRFFVNLDTPDVPTTGAAAAAWACLNTAMGVTSIERSPTLRPGPEPWAGTLTFRGLYRPEALAAVYTTLPFVRSVEADEPIGGHGSTICFEPGPSAWIYYFVLAGGIACPTGCDEHDVSGFSVSTDGEVTPLGIWGGGTGVWPDDLSGRLYAAGCLN